MSERKYNGIAVRAANGSVRRIVPNMLRRSILALAALVFVSAGPSRAQSQSATSKSAPAGTSTNVAVVDTAAVTQAATAKPVVETVASAAQSAPKGQHEGITVHGHWTIEVRNPDGTSVSRQEFENALVQPGGSVDLLFMLLGGWVPGGYRVQLGDSPNENSGPCPAISGVLTACVLEGSLISPTPSGFDDVASGCTGTSISPTGPCFPLSIKPLASNTGFVLSGTAMAAQADQITDVVVAPLVCPEPTNPPVYAVGTISPNICAQGAVGAWDNLTHATLSSPVQVTAAGQSITVTVQISFQ